MPPSVSPRWCAGPLTHTVPGSLKGRYTIHSCPGSFADEVEIGSATPTRDFVFVDDTARAFIALAKTPEATGRTVHFGTGREISIGDLARLAIRAAGREGISVRSEDPSRVRPPSSEVSRLVASSELARRLTGWEPRVSLEEGLEITAEWIRSHPSHYRLRGYRI